MRGAVWLALLFPTVVLALASQGLRVERCPQNATLYDCIAAWPPRAHVWHSLIFVGYTTGLWWLVALHADSTQNIYQVENHAY